MAVDEVSAGPQQVSRTALIAASPAELFDLVADPHRHGELDGSGTVKDTVAGPDRLSSGATFSVKMKQYGVPYRITSRVTDFQDGSVLEWRHPMGHRWRWEFVPSGDGSTQVTETWDASHVNGVMYAMFNATGVPKKNAVGIGETLRHLQSRYAG